MLFLTPGGVSASHLDIAPRHAGAVYGAGNTAATLAGLLSVPTTGLLLQATGSWPLVFAITSLHYCLGAAAYAAWAGDKPLPEDGSDEEPGTGAGGAGSAGAARDTVEAAVQREAASLSIVLGEAAKSGVAVELKSGSGSGSGAGRPGGSKNLPGDRGL